MGLGRPSAGGRPRGEPPLAREKGERGSARSGRAIFGSVRRSVRPSDRPASEAAAPAVEAAAAASSAVPRAHYCPAKAADVTTTTLSKPENGLSQKCLHSRHRQRRRGWQERENHHHIDCYYVAEWAGQKSVFPPRRKRETSAQEERR